jgi:hypothetical protein
MKFVLHVWVWLSIIVLLTACAAAPTASSPTATALPATQAPAPTTIPTVPPPTPTKVPSPTPAPTDPPPTIAPSPTIVEPTPVPPQGSEILFLRQGSLFAYAVDTSIEREIATGVVEMVAPRDGRLLIVVKDDEIWQVNRDGSEAQQLTTNDQFESGLSLSADGTTLAYVASTLEQPRPLTRPAWVAWCQVSEVRVRDLASGEEQTVGSGCDAAISADGQRVALATAPATDLPTAPANELQLYLRNQQDGWDQFDTFAPEGENALLVYAPAFAPDDSELSFAQYMGNQVETEVMYLQAVPAGQRERSALGISIGWNAPLRYSADGRYSLAIEYNYDDARGFSGYEIWRAMVLERGVVGEFIAPSGTFSTAAAEVERLSRAAAATWAPDESRLAVLLPSGWFAEGPAADPVFGDENPGEIRLWQPGEAPGEPIIRDVDYASPLIWLPPMGL